MGMPVVGIFNKTMRPFIALLRPLVLLASMAGMTGGNFVAVGVCRVYSDD